MSHEGIIVTRCTYTLTPLVPFESIEWYNLYHHYNIIEFHSHPLNKGLSMEQLYFILLLNRAIPECGKHYMHYLPHGIRCSVCKRLYSQQHFSELELQQQDHRVCRRCWNMRDHWSRIPISIKQILNIDIQNILSIFSQHQAHMGHTYIDDMFYVGNKIIMCNKEAIRVFIFEFRLWQSRSIHALLDSLGYIIAVNFDKKWILRGSSSCIYGVQLLPCIDNMMPLLPCVKGYQWIVNKARFGFI